MTGIESTVVSTACKGSNIDDDNLEVGLSVCMAVGQYMNLSVG